MIVMSVKISSMSNIGSPSFSFSNYIQNFVSALNNSNIIAPSIDISNYSLWSSDRFVSWFRLTSTYELISAYNTYYQFNETFAFLQITKNEGIPAIFIVHSPVTLEFMLVGGGGSGGYYSAGGGGGGGAGAVSQYFYQASAGEAFAVTVGDGGIPLTNTANMQGKDTYVEKLRLVGNSVYKDRIMIAYGGGYGGNPFTQEGGTGGSGGGGKGSANSESNITGGNPYSNITAQFNGTSDYVNAASSLPSTSLSATVDVLGSYGASGSNATPSNTQSSRYGTAGGGGGGGGAGSSPPARTSTSISHGGSPVAVSFPEWSRTYYNEKGYHNYIAAGGGGGPSESETTTGHEGGYAGGYNLPFNTGSLPQFAVPRQATSGNISGIQSTNFGVYLGGGGSGYHHRGQSAANRSGSGGGGGGRSETGTGGYGGSGIAFVRWIVL